MSTAAGKHVFISYVTENRDAVDGLCRLLDAAQIPYWRDRANLAPGDDWKHEIRTAIRNGSLVFLACFSTASIARTTTYMNEELTLAVEEARLRQLGATWLIPVRLDDVPIPPHSLGAGRDLTDLNYVDLFGAKAIEGGASLIATIGRVMGADAPDARTVQAAVAEAGSTERALMLRRLTKEMVQEPAKQIQLDDLVSSEIQGVISAIDANPKLSVIPQGGTLADQVPRLVTAASVYWDLARPFCCSLQIAGRWAPPGSFGTWSEGLRSLVTQALRIEGGATDMLRLRHVPALCATFTASLAAVGQRRWDNLKAAVIDTTVVDPYIGVRREMLDIENPWVPFMDDAQIPSILAQTARTGDDPQVVIADFLSGQRRAVWTPGSSWLHSILRSVFEEQFRDDATYDEQFDRTETMLGVISQDLSNVRAKAHPNGYARGATWFGRSTWRSNRMARNWNPVQDMADEFEGEQANWGPVKAGLFGGDAQRARDALGDYTLEWEKQRSHRY